MGKAKKKEDANSSLGTGLELDPRKVLKLEPEDRAAWMSKACKLAADHNFRVSSLFDTLSSEKFAVGLPDKVGKRMHRTLLKYLDIFTDKQQRTLKQSALPRAYALHDKPDEPKELSDLKPAKKKKSDDEDAALRMEEMMARCRGFVREKAATFEDRTKEVEEKEREAQRVEKLRLVREEAERKEREWQAIADWHRPIEGWEVAQMAENDLRAQQRAKEAKELREAIQATKKQQTEKRSASSRSSSRGKNKKPRSSSRSRSRRRRRGSSEDEDSRHSSDSSRSRGR